MRKDTYDFSGWATRNDLRCSDGRTIRRDAFKGNDGQTVPLVWNHDHNDPMNVLGHALLENRDEGVYTYCTFNSTPAGSNAKQLVQHGDVTGLSIYANKLIQEGGNVVHGAIREVSLVLAGANPGAFIDNVIEHGDFSDEAAIIYNGENIELAHTVTDKGEPHVGDADAAEEKEPAVKQPKRKAKVEKQESAKEELEHSENEGESMDRSIKNMLSSMSNEQKSALAAYLSHADEEEDEKPEENGKGKTVKDVFDSLTEEQKTVVYALIGQALEDAKGEKEGDETVKHNIFDSEGNEMDVLSHSEMTAIFDDAKRGGSLKDAFIAHGIEDIEYLFPDAKNMTTAPEFIKDPDDWVTKVMNGVRHTPFSRIKTMFADITEADARAKGYVKGNRKVEEVFGLLRRVTTPTTIYKKQKLDRDDVIDITDFDVVAWLKTEMRAKLNEEIARAVLIGDGRAASSEDKISESNVRPIWTDDDLYTIKKVMSVASNADDSVIAKAFIQAAVKARKGYRGTGNPTLFTTEDMLTNCLLMEDTTGRIIYDSVDKLATALRVKEIVTVPPMENVYREADGTTYGLSGLIVNLHDYNIGADKGGAVNMFDDFDIDYNAQKYLIETRISGALVKPYSAIALEMTYSAILDVEAESATAVILGKTVSTLQEDVVVHDKYIKGTLHYVTGYTNYSGTESEQSGNFLALKFEASTGATTTVQLTGSNADPVTLDSDMNCVFRITNKNTQKIKVVTTLGDDTITKTYSLTGLTLETE